MSRFHYLKQELYYRFGRSTVTLVSVSLVVSMAVTLTAISNASSDALRLPLDNVGADIVVQLSGDIPKKPEGLVFPHSTPQMLLGEWVTFLESSGTLERYFCGNYLQANFSHFWELTLEALQEYVV